MKSTATYSVLNGIGVLLTVLGALSLLGHLAGQIGKGSASAASLVGGCGSFLLGLVLLVLADLGTRLVRIETRLGTLPNDDFADGERPPSKGSDA